MQELGKVLYGQPSVGAKYSKKQRKKHLRKHKNMITISDCFTFLRFFHLCGKNAEMQKRKDAKKMITSYQLSCVVWILIENAKTQKSKQIDCLLSTFTIFTFFTLLHFCCKNENNV